MAYVPDHRVHAPTLIFVPTQVHYRHGYCARTTGASVRLAPGSDLLQVRNARTGHRVTVDITPGRCTAPESSPGGLRVVAMCRNITTLRGLDPVATPEEIEAAARQYVRKVSGVQKTSAADREPFERAVTQITKATTALLATLPPRKQPPPTLPPLRRIAARGKAAAST